MGYIQGRYYYHEPAKRFYVRVKGHKIWKYNDLPILHEKIAEKLINKIRAEIDDGTFDIRFYLPDSPLNLKAYSEVWLSGSKSCQNTKRVHRSAIKKASEATDKKGNIILGDCDIRKITFGKMSTIQQSMAGSIKWKNSVLIALKAMLNYARKDGVIKQLPPFPELEEHQQGEVEYLTFAEQQKVIEAMPERHRSVFLFGMEFGLRIGEVRALKKDCIVDGQLIVKRSFSQWELREKTKVGKMRRLPLTTRAHEILKNAPPSFGEYLFTFNGKLPYYERKMREIWKAACVVAGIKINQKNAIRHSLGCQMLDNGVDLEMVRDIYGHSSTDMTRKYVTRTPIRMLEALENRGKVIEIRKKEEGE